MVLKLSQMQLLLKITIKILNSFKERFYQTLMTKPSLLEVVNLISGLSNPNQ